MENQESAENTANQDSAETVAHEASDGPYEFSDADNVLFKGLALRMSALGFFLLVLATLDMPALLRGDRTAAVVAFLYVVTGAWSFFTAYSVRSIVETEGKDISHLMLALKSLRRLLTLAVLLVVTLLALDARELLVSAFNRVF